MKVRLARTVGLQNDTLKAVYEFLLPFSGVMQFELEERPLAYHTDPFPWSDFFTEVTRVRKDRGICPEDFLIVLTELKNNLNWFSAPSPGGENSIFIQATDWENYIYCDPVYPIAYEVIVNVIDRINFPDFEEMMLSDHIHRQPVGCINDLCGWKPDITFKLRTGDICADCQSFVIERAGLPILKQTIEIFDQIRRKTVFVANYLQEPPLHEQLPFSVAITKRKLGMTLEPFRKMLMLIDHFDSIIRTSVIMIACLFKQQSEIEKFFEKLSLDDRPHLGQWVEALAALCKETRGQEVSLQLPPDFNRKVKKVVSLAQDVNIMNIRNEKRGHGYIECHDENYKQTFTECLPALEEMEKLLSPLFLRFKYYHVIGISRVAGKRFAVRVHRLSGSNPAFIEESIEADFSDINDIPQEKRVYLVTPDKRKWSDLDPYIQFSTCNICKHMRLLIADGIYLLDPYIGHRFEKR